MKNAIKTTITTLLLGSALMLGACGGNGGGNGGGGGGSSNTFIMEAEYVDFTGIVGGGNSCEKRECGMIYGEGTDEEKALGWSNGYFVAYTHKTGVRLTFNFTSDKEVNNATLVIRMASEMGATTFSPDEFEVNLNGEAIDYTGQYLQNYGTLEEMRFADKTISSRCHIEEGANVLYLEILENNLTGAGTIGPIIDCVKITSTAQLSWEPLLDNPDHRGEI